MEQFRGCLGHYRDRIGDDCGCPILTKRGAFWNVELLGAVFPGRD